MSFLGSQLILHGNAAPETLTLTPPPTLTLPPTLTPTPPADASAPARAWLPTDLTVVPT